MNTYTDYLRASASQAEPWAGDIPPGRVLETLRQQVGLSQEQLANVFSVSRLTLRHYESGETVKSRALSSLWARRVISALFEEATKGRSQKEALR